MCTPFAHGSGLTYCQTSHRNFKLPPRDVLANGHTCCSFTKSSNLFARTSVIQTQHVSVPKTPPRV